MQNLRRYRRFGLGIFAQESNDFILEKAGSKI